MHRLKSFLLYLPVLAIAGLPLVFSWQSLDPVLMPRFIYITAIVLLMATLILANRKAILAFPSVPAFFLCVFFITGLIASIHTLAPSETYYSLGKDFLFIVFLLFLTNLLQREKIHLLVKSILVLNLVILATTAYDIYSLGHLPKLEETYLVAGSLAHRNLLASATALCLPFTFYASWHFRKFWRIAGFLLGLVSVVLIILLQSRGALIGLGVFVLVLIFLWIWRRFSSIRFIKPLIWISAVAGIIFTISFGYLHFFNKLDSQEINLKNQMLGSEDSNQNFTAWERMFMWQATARMILEEPFEGVGPGQWKIVFPKYSVDVWRTRQGMIQFQRPHNDFLWIWAENGFFGLLALLGFFVSSIFIGLKALLSSNIRKADKDLVQLILAVFCTYLAISFFSFPRERMIHQILLFSSFAMLFVLTRSEVKWSFFWKKLTYLPVLTAILLSIPLIAMGYTRWRGEVLTQKMLYERASSNWYGVLRNHERLENSIFYTMDPTSVPIAFYAGLAYLNLEKPEEAEEYFLKAYRIHPNNIHVINNLANTYQLKGDFTNALIYYKQALEVAPLYKDGVLNLAAAHFNNNEVEKAYQVLAQHEDVFDEGKNKFHAYLVPILSTIRDNYHDSIQSEKMQQALLSLGPDALIEIHEAAKKRDDSLMKLMEDAATKKLKNK